MSNNQRRDFIKNLGLAGAAITLGTASAAASTKETFIYLKQNNKLFKGDNINIALIGAGGMGNADADTCLKHDGVNMVAVCDLYQGRLENAKKKWGNDVFVTTNYKEILNKKDVDAVIIGTTDHWHKQISIEDIK